MPRWGGKAEVIKPVYRCEGGNRKLGSSRTGCGGTQCQNKTIKTRSGRGRICHVKTSVLTQAAVLLPAMAVRGGTVKTKNNESKIFLLFMLYRIISYHIISYHIISLLHMNNRQLYRAWRGCNLQVIYLFFFQILVKESFFFPGHFAQYFPY